MRLRSGALLERVSAAAFSFGSLPGVSRFGACRLPSTDDEDEKTAPIVCRRFADVLRKRGPLQFQRAW